MSHGVGTLTDRLEAPGNERLRQRGEFVLPAPTVSGLPDEAGFFERGEVMVQVVLPAIQKVGQFAALQPSRLGQQAQDGKPVPDDGCRIRATRYSTSTPGQPGARCYNSDFSRKE